MEFVGRFLQIPDRSCFLLGPRGTGKPTWLRHRLPDALYLDLLDPTLHRSLGARPGRLRELLAGAPGKRPVVIDEIERVPELLTVIHAILEEPSPPHFVLTGSGARKLRRGGVDLLGGSAVHRTMRPFMASELPEFDLDRVLRLGLLPHSNGIFEFFEWGVEVFVHAQDQPPFGTEPRLLPYAGENLQANQGAVAPGDYDFLPFQGVPDQLGEVRLGFADIDLHGHHRLRIHNLVKLSGHVGLVHP